MRTGLGQVQGITLCECKNKRTWKAIEVFLFLKRLIMFCFNAAWTILFSTTYMLWYVDGASHFLANVASSVFWLLATSALWVRPPFIFRVVFQLRNIKGHRNRFYAHHANGRELCTTSGNFQMSTVFDGRSFRMDRVRIVCTDNGGDLFMDDFEWMEETN